MKKVLAIAITLSMASGLQARSSWIKAYKANPEQTIHELQHGTFSKETNPTQHLTGQQKKLACKVEGLITHNQYDHAILAFAGAAFAARCISSAPSLVKAIANFISDLPSPHDFRGATVQETAVLLALLTGVGSIYALMASSIPLSIKFTTEHTYKALHYTQRAIIRLNAVLAMQEAAAQNPSIQALNEAAAESMHN